MNKSDKELNEKIAALKAERDTLKAELAEQIEQRASEHRINDALGVRCQKAESQARALGGRLAFVLRNLRALLDRTNWASQTEQVVVSRQVMERLLCAEPGHIGGITEMAPEKL